MLAFHSVGHHYGDRPVLQGIDLRLERGRVLALSGPSGCGKTTILHLAAGLLTPTEGAVQNRFRRTAYIFQEPRLLPWRTAGENIAYGLKAMGVPAGERRQVAAALAGRLGLADALERYPHQLSGGMRQRVALGRALAIGPDLLLMDEPFSALDAALKAELQDLVLALITERGLSALFVTHDLTEAQRMGDELITLSTNPGRVVQRLPRSAFPTINRAGVEQR